MHRFQTPTGGALVYDRIGDGGTRCVVFLHGLSNSSETYQRVISSLVADANVERPLQILAIDLRGHGLSSHVPTNEYRAEDFAGDIAALLVDERIGSATVVGHSLGGVVAMSLAVQHPAVVSALLLEDPPLFEGDDARRAASPVASIFPKVVAAVRAMQDRGAPQGEFEAMVAEQPGAHDVTQRAVALQTWDPMTMQAAIDGVVWNGFDPQSRVTCPLTVLRADPAFGAVFSEADGEELLRHNPHAHIVAVTGAGHSIHSDAFDDYMSELREFLATTRQE